MESFLTVVRALSHKDRLRIIKLLQHTSLTAAELAEVLQQSESEVADHVSVLGDADLLVALDDEKGKVLHINPDRSNLYGAVILALLDGWLNEDTDVKEDRKRAEDLLEAVGLKERMNHKPAELSGGERQRVAIARALANNPKFLLMDEPTGNIDSKTANELIELVKRLNAENGVTIIVVTHDQQIASKAKRTVQMIDGLIVKEEVN